MVQPAMSNRMRSLSHGNCLRCWVRTRFICRLDLEVCAKGSLDNGDDVLVILAVVSQSSTNLARRESPDDGVSARDVRVARPVLDVEINRVNVMPRTICRVERLSDP